MDGWRCECGCFTAFARCRRVEIVVVVVVVIVVNDITLRHPRKPLHVLVRKHPLHPRNQLGHVFFPLGPDRPGDDDHHIEPPDPCLPLGP